VVLAVFECFLRSEVSIRNGCDRDTVLGVVAMCSGCLARNVVVRKEQHTGANKGRRDGSTVQRVRESVGTVGVYGRKNEG